MSNTAYFVTDVEASARSPQGVMLTCGLIKLDSTLEHRFYGRFRPPANAAWDPTAEAVHGISREEAMTFPHPAVEAKRLANWLDTVAKGKEYRLMTDNPTFDVGHLIALVMTYCGKPLFGHSGRRIGDLYCGLVGRFDANAEWKEKYRPEELHDHNSLNDAVANAIALIAFCKEYNLALPLD